MSERDKLRTNRRAGAHVLANTATLPHMASMKVPLRSEAGKNSLSGYWLRASDVVNIDPSTYVPQEFIPDEVLTRMHSDRGRPHPIPSRPEPIPDRDEDFLCDPALWDFREEVRVCDECGEGFVARTHNQRYCSTQCRDMGSQNAVVCARCGREFHTNRRGQRYCSLSCSGAAKRRTAQLPRCELCDRPFRASKASQRFCSRACAWAWRKSKAADVVGDDERTGLS